jgi:hypothetical protein
MDKLSISNEMLRFDQKDRDFYDSLTEEERKKFSPFLMIRYGSTVSGNPDLQAYYLMSCNERLNKNFFDVNTTQHKKLQWLLATTVSPGMGKQFHQWISPKKKDSSNNKVEKLLRELYPQMKDDEITLLATLNTRDDLKQLLKSQGWDDKRIKEYL